MITNSLRPVSQLDFRYSQTGDGTQRKTGISGDILYFLLQSHFCYNVLRTLFGLGSDCLCMGCDTYHK